MQYRVNYAARRVEVVDATGIVTHAYVFPGGSQEGLPSGTQPLTLPPALLSRITAAMDGDQQAQAAVQTTLSEASRLAAEQQPQQQGGGSGETVPIGFTPAQVRAHAGVANSAIDIETSRRELEAAEAQERQAWAGLGYGAAPFAAPTSGNVPTPGTVPIPPGYANDPEMIGALTTLGDVAAKGALAARKAELERVRAAREVRTQGAARLTDLAQLRQSLEDLDKDYEATRARLSVDPGNDAKVAALHEQWQTQRQRLIRNQQNVSMTYWPEETQKNTIRQQYQEINGPAMEVPEGLDPLGWSYTYNEAKRTRGYAGGGVVPELPGTPMGYADPSRGPEHEGGVGGALRRRPSAEEAQANDAATMLRHGRDEAMRNAGTQMAELDRAHAARMEQYRAKNAAMDQAFLEEAAAIQAQARAAVAQNPYILQMLR